MKNSNRNCDDMVFAGTRHTLCLRRKYRITLKIEKQKKRNPNGEGTIYYVVGTGHALSIVKKEKFKPEL